MWLFNLFASDRPCPWCGDTGARGTFWGALKCPNPRCNGYSPELVAWRERAELKAPVAAGAVVQYRNPRTGERVYKPQPIEEFDPTGYRIEVQYENRAGMMKTFVGDWRTLRRRGQHVSLKVSPTGKRIALAIERIQNYADVEQMFVDQPAPQEMRVMRYHARRGTTSLRCDELRRKYPHWSPQA